MINDTDPTLQLPKMQDVNPFLKIHAWEKSSFAKSDLAKLAIHLRVGTDVNKIGSIVMKIINDPHIARHGESAKSLLVTGKRMVVDNRIAVICSKHLNTLTILSIEFDSIPNAFFVCLEKTRRKFYRHNE